METNQPEAPQAPQPEAPAAENKPVEASQKSGNEKQTEQKEPESVSRATKIYLKQQADLRRQFEEKEKAFKEREGTFSERETTLSKKEAELQARAEKIAQLEEWGKQLEQRNPFPFLNAHKLDLETLYNLGLQQERDPQAIVKLVLEEARKEYQPKFEEIAQQQQKEREQIQQAQAQKNLEASKQRCSEGFQNTIASNPERYELASQYEHSALVATELVCNVYQETGRGLSLEEALDAVENWLEEEVQAAQRFSGTSKAKKFVPETPTKDVLSFKRERSADPKDRSKSTQRASKSNPEPRTLQAKKMTSVQVGAPSDETPEERRERLWKALREGTYEPSQQ